MAEGIDNEKAYFQRVNAFIISSQKMPIHSAVLKGGGVFLLAVFMQFIPVTNDKGAI